MHAVTFQMKRAHLSGVAFGKKALTKVRGMTPGRFDLLYALFEQVCCPFTKRLGLYSIRQDVLWKRLGLHGSTVSKMVKRLVAMGWLEREPKCPSDARSNTLTLTVDGLRAIRHAMRRIFRMRTHFAHFERFFKAWSPHKHVVTAIRDFWHTVETIARSLGDASTFLYDYGLKLDV